MSSVEAVTKTALSLNSEQRMALLVKLWESLAPEPEPISEAELRLVEQSLADYRKRPRDTIPLEDAEKRLRERR
jgi:putative addiction module component (TIGR02574 family)